MKQTRMFLTSGKPITTFLLSLDKSFDVWKGSNVFDIRVASSPSGPATASNYIKQFLYRILNAK